MSPVIENSKLTPEESAQYMNIVKKGNMDDMFDWAYLTGRIHVLKEMKLKAEEELKDL